MKFFIAALIATLAAAADWAPKAECLTFLDEQARWLALRANVAFVSKDESDWTPETKDAFDQQIEDLKEAPAGELSEANRATARQLLEGIDWVKKGTSDVITLSTQTGYPTYSSDYAADCVEPVVPTVTATLGLENSNSVVQNAEIVDASGKGVEVTAVTGWKKFGGGSDAAVGYQLAVDFASASSWNGQGSNSVALIFGNDSEVTNLEYNEFNVVNFAQAAKQVRINYLKTNIDSVALPAVAGYPIISDDKTYTVSWAEGRGNWAAGALANVEYGANQDTSGFWSIVRDNTKLLQGQAAADSTQVLLTVQKETLGTVTTNIKAGGKIHGVVCYKANSASEACTAKSGVTEFKWAAEPVVPDNGNTDNSGTGGDDENTDSAMSMAGYGASFLAAISALAF